MFRLLAVITIEGGVAPWFFFLAALDPPVAASRHLLDEEPRDRALGTLLTIRSIAIRTSSSTLVRTVTKLYVHTGLVQ